MALGFTPLKPANNLSDVASPATALANLGGAAALGFTPLRPANNLNDVASPATALANLGGLSNAVTVNGHSLSSNVTVSASDLTTGTLPHAQLPALLSGDVPNNAANTSGNAGNVTGTVSTTNGGTGANTPAGGLLALGVGLCSVKNSGATGNGTTDDTTSIQAAITTCAGAYTGGFGPTLYFPAGTFKISAALRVPGYLNIKGEGYQASVIKQTCGTCNIFTAYQNGYWLGASFLGGGISDLMLEGSGYLTTGTMLELQSTGGYVVHNVGFYNHGGRGITLGEGSERSKLTNLFFQNVRWPEVNQGYEMHNIGLIIDNPGSTADSIAPPGYSPSMAYCYGVNCVNGIYPAPGGQTVVSTSGSGTAQSYVLSGTQYSPVMVGHNAYFAGCSISGYNGYFAVTGVANNTPTGEFTLTVAGSATGSATGCTFKTALRPDNQHAAVWGNGQQLSFEDGEIKPLTYISGFKFADVNGTRADEFYLEGYINPVSPSVIVGGILDQLVCSGTFASRTVGNMSTNNTAPTAFWACPVGNNIWWPGYINDPNDVPAYYTAGYGGAFVKIFPPDYNPIGTIGTGSVSGNVLTVTAVATGTYSVGQLITGTGVTSGTQITSLGSGTGLTGTYNLNNSMTTSSATITGTSYSASNPTVPQNTYEVAAATTSSATISK